MLNKFFVLSLVVVLFSSGCFAKKEGNVIARFDGNILTEEEFLKRYARLPKDLQGVIYRQKKGLVDEVINEYFLVKEAGRRGVEKEADVRELLKEAHNKIIAAKLIETEVDKKVKLEPDQALNYYEAHKEEFMTTTLLRASHILLKTQEEAQVVREELLKGADFEELARKRSADSSSVRGGDIGFFQKGQLIPEFESVAFSMKKGELSPVFKTQFGYHVLKLTDRAEPALRDFHAVKNLVERQLLNQKRAKIFKQYLEKIKGETKVQIDEKKLDEISLTPPSK